MIPSAPESRPWRIAAGLIALILGGATSVAAQGSLAPTLPASSPFHGGVSQGTAAEAPLALSIADAIHRALANNLGVVMAEQDQQRAGGARRLALSRLLPNVQADISASTRRQSLEAFGLPLGPGFPRIVGPFEVYDARLSASQTVFDLSAIQSTRAESHNVTAARLSYRDARELVVLVSANLYLQALAAAARVETARAQLATSEALFAQAEDLKRNGLVPGIDVLRADVQRSTDRQHATAAANEFEKTKLQLARVIGLPVGQTITLSGTLPLVPIPQMTTEDALARAYRDRPDYQAAQERLAAAEASRAAALAEHLPTVHVNADWGAIGLTPGSALGTFNVTGAVSVPIFQGGRPQGHLAQADADVRDRRAALADLRAGIDYDVRSALLDLQATGELMQTATRARELAAQALTQARDRFAAGVTDNIEVVQAQESVTQANEQYISALYGYNVSKALLARSLGAAEEAVQRYLGGSTNP